MARRFDDITPLVDPYAFVLTDLVSAARVTTPTDTDGPIITRDPLFMDGDDYAGDSTTTGVIIIDGPATTGNFDFSGDVDAFAFEAVAGEVYNFALTNVFFSAGYSSFFTSSDTSSADYQSVMDFSTQSLNFTTDLSGTYFLSLVEGPGTSNPYTITATNIIDELSDDEGTTGFLATDGTVLQSAFSTKDDIDWVVVSGAEGQVLTFRVNIQGSGSYPTIRAFDDQTNEITITEFIEDAGDLVFSIAPNQDSDIYIELTPPFQGFTLNQIYNISATLSADDYANDASTMTVLPLDDSIIAGTLEYATDSDWFRFDVDAGQAVQFKVPEVFYGDELTLLDSDGNILAGGGTSFNPNNPSILSWVFADAGTYFIRVDGDLGQNFDVGDGSYNLTAIAYDGGLTDEAEDIELPLDGSVITTTTQWYTDVDSFVFTITDPLALSITGTAEDGTRVKLEVEQIIDVNGNPIDPGFGDYERATNELGFNFTNAGTYRLYVSSEDVNLTDISLSVAPAVDDYAADTTTTGTLTLGTDVTGSLELSGDDDWFAFDGVAGETVTFGLGSGNVDDAMLRVFDANGDLVYDGFGGVTTILENTGTYYLSVFQRNDLGDYTITSEVLTDDFGNTLENAEDIVVGARDVLFGSLDYANDRDMFAFEVVDGQAVYFRIGPQDGGDLGRDIFIATILNSDFSEFDSVSGEVIAERSFQYSDGGFLMETREGLADGTYYVLLENRYGDANNPNDAITDDYYFFSRRILNGDDSNNDLIGSEFRDRIFGEDGDDEIYGLGSNDQIIAGDGDDLVHGGGQSDIIYGGFGDDFIYGDAAIGLTGLEGQLYRAYQSVFNRAPDAEGFGLYLREMLAGNQDQVDVVTQFVASAEFVQTYGELSTVDFVALLFANVLPDNTDPVGPQNYVNEIEAGNLTRTEMVIELTNTAEFVARMNDVSAAFGNNVITNPAEAEVYRIYQAVFNREPDADGFTAYVNSLQVGVLSVAEITAQFVNSDEFQQTYGELDDAAFVELLYTNVLPGNTDPNGRAAYTAALEAETLTRADVVVEFAQSQELRDGTTEAVASFVGVIFEGDGDSFYGQEGVDYIYGGRGADRFNFENDADNLDIILDFTAGVDVLRVYQRGADLTFNQIMELGSQEGSNATFEFDGGHVLVLMNVSLDDLSEVDFGFEAPIGQAPRDTLADTDDAVSQASLFDVDIDAEMFG